MHYQGSPAGVAIEVGFSLYIQIKSSNLRSVIFFPFSSNLPRVYRPLIRRLCENIFFPSADALDRRSHGHTMVLLSGVLPFPEEPERLPRAQRDDRYPIR